VTGQFFRFWKALPGLALALLPGAAFAEAGQPVSGQIGFQDSVTPIMDEIEVFHNDLLIWIVSGIVLLVLALLVVVIVRFNAKANPVPSRTTHNTLIEIIWTVAPILILVVIAIPSFRLLYYSDKAPDAAMTVKVTGHQWYWQYEYPDQGNFSIDSRILAEADRVKEKPQIPRLFAVDQEMVIPVNTTIRIIGTAADVMHGWTVPGFGIKKTVIPGRLNEGWINVEHECYYFGQCSQICGQNHTYMPIAVRVVSKAEFDKWVEQHKKTAGLTRPTHFAAATVPANR